MLKCYKISVIKAAISGMLALFLAGSAIAGPLDESIAIEKQTTVASSKSQKKIDRFAEQTYNMESDYKSTLRIVEQLQIYNNQLDNLIESQEKEMASVEAQMATIDATERGVIPLMNEMIATLDKFIQLDLPFLKEVREERVETLKNTMIRADISNSEKYRLILQAYQIELSYGESFASFQGTIPLNGVETKVDFLRFGRVLLVYMALDGQSVGYYNSATGQYEPLGDEYIRSIELGIKMANKQAAPELIKLPVIAAQGAN